MKQSNYLVIKKFRWINVDESASVFNFEAKKLFVTIEDTLSADFLIQNNQDTEGDVISFMVLYKEGEEGY